ncbi:hypothetical protein A1O1_00197 [Capronia coronata CBS 617.96]|uniref:Uncharacterized protein n=1 Tax=Capronia coronata CBS 617.96 TaxID=1182541 RepID=W9ZKP4_9EURO|nr:uncharacterized protein A1O1_00197 [Capronia coronata CBS 617.96]EXJ95079.1 hypothetical protein A1O1_00197 [Capronia coronata CBS 617.96]
MAPTATKRARPSFSPPRPGKSKVTKSVKPSSINGPNKRSRISNGAGQTTSKQAPKKKQRRRGTGGTLKAILGDEDDSDSDNDNEADRRGHQQSEEQEESEEDEPGVSEDSDEGEQEDNEDEDDDEEEEEEEQPLSPEAPSSPEPEFILAEITHTASNATKSVAGSSAPAIPVPLLHRIMQSHFTEPEKTSIASDARALFGTYIEIFVKEGIRRCVEEKKEREGVGGGGVDSGWLELEDLESVATQLCLDF